MFAEQTGQGGLSCTDISFYGDELVFQGRQNKGFIKTNYTFLPPVDLDNLLVTD